MDDVSSTAARDAGAGSASVSRREFLRACLMAAAAVGLAGAAAEQVVAAAAAGAARPSVVWLQFQECTGCTMSLLRPSNPGLDTLIFDLISLDYHETLFAAAGRQAEEARRAAVEKNAGRFICVVEGAIPAKDGGVYCMVGGRTALDITREVASKSAAVVAIGSCSSWGGLPSAAPNPTGAVGVHQVVRGRPVVNLPGCPPNPYIFLGVVLQYAALGRLPELDAEGRPKFAYARTVHDDCARLPHYKAGRFAEEFGDEGHRQGHCLYKLGCKGPLTRANCAVLPFNEVPGAWPVNVGHPCFGCTEKNIAFETPLRDTFFFPRFG